MAQEWNRSAWYDQTEPQPVQSKQPEQNKRKGLKVLGLVCFLVVICAATVYLMTGGFGLEQRWTVTVRPGFGESLPEPDTQSDAPSDYRAYFRMWREASKTEERSGSRLERTTPETAPELSPASAEGLEELSLQELYERCAPSVVSVSCRFGEKLSQAWGSGIILSEDGFILTNQHVIEGAETATVILADGSEYAALLVGEDTATDIALLKIEARGLPAAEFGDSGALRVGDPVAAIGTPLSSRLTGTLTDGIISAINREINVKGSHMTLLQTDVAINEGNSGGPLFNRYGQVVGITNMKMVNAYSSVTVEGIGFAIPTATVAEVVEQLGRSGSVTGRPALGITVTEVDEDLSDYYRIPRGLYVQIVEPGSDAKAQGIQVDDIITKAEGQYVRSTQDLLELRDAHSVGDSLSLTLWRNGETRTVTIRLVDQNDLN